MEPAPGQPAKREDLVLQDILRQKLQGRLRGHRAEDPIGQAKGEQQRVRHRRAAEVHRVPALDEGRHLGGRRALVLPSVDQDGRRR